jgi:membrane fusion protein (multidrug efflux system)
MRDIPPPLPRVVVLAVVLGLAPWLPGCGKDGANAASAPASNAVQVTVKKMAFEKVPLSVDAVGRAEGSREVEIRARVTGILEKRLFEEGTALPAGATLYQIDPAPYELEVQQAKATLQQEKARKELAEQESTRLAPLVQTRAVSQREADAATSNVRTTAAAIALAEARLKEAELNLSYTRVVAPIGGVTGRSLRSEGSLVTVNTDSALLTTVTRVDPVWVRFSLAEPDFERIRSTQKQASVQLVARDGTLVSDKGRMNFAASTIDNKTGAVELRAEFPNPDLRWLPGQFLKVRVLAGEQTAMRVPQAAVQQNEQSRIVMTVGPDGKAAPRAVQTSSWIGNDMVITGGLKEGEQVIVDNLVKVRPGTAVQPTAER